MSTYQEIRKVEKKYEKELSERKSNGEEGELMELLSEVVNDLKKVSGYASWDDYPDMMGK